MKESSISETSENKRSWEKAAEKYIKNCHKFEIKIDPSIVIALQTGYKKQHLVCCSLT